ncbi:TonB-dependent receptor [Sphingobium sp. EM0848]|uniref:TonB-dependent receptor n=1 Tax=Sphingobium sp. EM0848 TaxID=2743473 RepID=UPI00159C0FD5|nr:TonB-dependent receptor [Sphingobium sp. EM0848]
MTYLTTTAVAALVAVLVPATAHAQDATQAESTSDMGLKEIVVTAQKRAENLQSTPLAISALSAEAIEARSITSVANLSAIAPSLTVARGTAGPTNASVFIRGIGNQDPILTADSPVALYVDGVILARSAGSAFEMADLERIEVLRGPQGTLYGRNTIGGAINLITRKPADSFGVWQKFTLGNYGEFLSRTVVDTGELGETGLRGAFTYMHKQRDGYVDDVNAPDKRDPGAYRTDGLRAALAFDRGGAFRASYAYDYNRNKGYPSAFQLTAARPDITAFFAGSPVAGGGSFTVSPTRLDRIALDHNGAVTDKVQGHTLTLEWDIGTDTTLKSLTGYRKWRQLVADSDLDGNAGLLGRVMGQGGALMPVELFGASALRHQHQWSQELNLIGKVGATLDYVLGAYYFKEESDETNPQRFSVILPGGALPRISLLTYDHESTTKALFAQGTWHVTDRLSLTGGARYTWDEKALDQVSPVVRTLEKSFRKFNWAATADYKVSNDVMAYARVATGYKAGGFNARSFDTGFDPENLTSYEIGLKTELFDRRLRFNATAYYADHKDVQVTSFQAGAAGATAVTLNAGKARYKGIELEVNAAPVRGLTTYATLGYVDRKYKEFLFFDTVAGRTVDIAGIAHFPYSASTTFNAGAKYEFPAFSFGKLAAQLDYNYMSKRYFNPNPLSAPFSEQMAAAPRGLLDARLTLSELPIGGSNVTLSVWGKNITDKKYKVVGIDFGQLGFAGNIYGEPASYGVDLGIKF